MERYLCAALLFLLPIPGCDKKSAETSPSGPAATSGPRHVRFADALELALGRPLAETERARLDEAVDRGIAEGTGGAAREFEGFADVKESRGAERERHRQAAIEWLRMRIAGDGGLEPWKTAAQFAPAKAPIETPVTPPDPAPPVRIEHPLVGAWGSSSFGMNWVDPGLDPTGLNLADAHTGTSWRFNEDGSFSRLCISRGQFINGATYLKGCYRVEGGVLVLQKASQSWYPTPKDARRRPAYRDQPSPDETRAFSIDPDGQTLRIQETATGGPDSYRRVR